ncbi:MAG: FHA domain-containing protein [Pyrinomonadaceae bacterium]
MPVLVIKSPSRMVEHYQLGWLSVTIGPSDLHDIKVSEQVQAEVYSEDGRYYLRPLGQSATPRMNQESPAITYNEEGVYSPVVLKHKGRIVIGRTVIDFREVDGREAARRTPSPSAGDSTYSTFPGYVQGDAAGSTAAGLGELLENESDLAWLAPEIMRRAAVCYEQTGMMRDAAQCWLEAGETGNAADIFLRLNDSARAAPLLMAQGRYREALRCYREWLAAHRQPDPTAEVRAQLGVVTCLTRLGEEGAAARLSYLSARRLVESTEARSPVTAGRCWEALGDFGVLAGRADLVQIAYEQALEFYGDRHNGERTRVAREYLKAVVENHLLVSQIEQRLAEWSAPEEPVEQQLNFAALSPDMGARFGDWVLWRTAGKLILLTHKQSRTRLEIWTDSPGWFMWARPKQTVIIRTDGSETVTRIRPELDAYFEVVPALTLANSPVEVDNYLIEPSPENLTLTNTVKGVRISLLPDRSHFHFIGANGQTEVIGRGT